MKKLTIIKGLTLLAMMTFATVSFMGCSTNKDTDNKEDAAKSQEASDYKELKSIPQDVAPSTENLPVATIKIKDLGTMEVELYPSIAPNTVNNFISLSNSGFYNGLIFHRIIEDFMVQGGDPLGNGQGGPGYSIKGEFSSNGKENNLKHKVGIISMARSLDKDSAGSQFFIVTKDSPHLDGEYTSFGRVISGMDILSKMNAVKTDSKDKPTSDVVIESITVNTKGISYNEPEKLEEK